MARSMFASCADMDGACHQPRGTSRVSVSTASAKLSVTVIASRPSSFPLFFAARVGVGVLGSHPLEETT